MRHRHSLAVILATTALAVPAMAEEGMWTFDAFPAEKMRADYGWAPDQAWLDRVRAGAVRLTGGCSASFVSPDGLILTNHHCISSCLAAISTPDTDYLAEGFNVARRDDEMLCPGQQAEVVTDIGDVTTTVKAVAEGLDGEAAVKARRGRIAELESGEGCTDESARCEVVSLYGGGQYKLYRYRKYSDVRVAWAPEAQAAQFGGDPDNFNFPRFSMDGAFLRAYEGGRPASTPDHLEWSARAPEDGEITFVVGNPGSTQRLYTLAQLDYLGDVQIPRTIAVLSELRGRLISAMADDPQKAREGADMLGSVENSLKVYLGQQRALGDDEFLSSLAEREAQLKTVAADDAAIGDPWSDIEKAVAYARANSVRAAYDGPSSTLYGYAETLVRAAKERAKPNEERYPGYSDSDLALRGKRLLDARAIHPWMEEMRIAWSLSKAREYLGTDDPQTRLLLGKESPEGLAERLVEGTRLADPEVRKALWDGGLEAVMASDDPMIRYALRLDENSRRISEAFDENYGAPLTQAGAKIADARFAAFGDSLYPDATFTLRISYGQVKSWEENGVLQPTRTTIGGTFARATGAPPYDLPDAFAARADAVDPETVYNFVSTNDIIGGNSGSPVLDREGKVIGAAFDGNIHVTGGAFGYNPGNNRMISVSTEALEAALRVYYPAPRILAELNGE